VTRLRRDVPVRFARLLKRLMERSPDDRPDGAEAVVGELRSIRAELSAVRDKSLTVVILEDDEDVLYLLEGSVRVAAPGAQVVTVRTSEEALERIRRRAPDVLIVDVQGPRRSGVELCLSLKNARISDKVAIIAVGGPGEARDPNVLRQLGIRDHVAKGPSMVDEVTKAVRKVARPK
jgi:DNA-binding response OmpR family regulator